MKSLAVMSAERNPPSPTCRRSRRRPASTGPSAAWRGIAGAQGHAAGGRARSSCRCAEEDLATARSSRTSWRSAASAWSWRDPEGFRSAWPRATRSLGAYEGGRHRQLTLARPAGGEARVRINDAVIGASLVLFALAMIWHTRTFPAMPGQNYGPALFPVLIGIGLRCHRRDPDRERLRGRSARRSAGSRGGDWLRSPQPRGQFVAVSAACSSTSWSPTGWASS